MQTRSLLVLATLAIGCDLADPGQAGNLVPRTVAEDPTLPAIELAGTRIHLETFGDPANPPLIFLHGGPGGDYRALLRLRDPDRDGARLEDDHYLVFWDQRGAGLSERLGADAIDLDVYLGDLEAIIERYAGGRPPVLIGHSWGGMYATAYVDRDPDRIAGLVLLEPGPLTGALYDELADQIFTIDLTSEWANDFLWGQRFLSTDDHARLDYAPLVAMRDAQPGYHMSKEDPMPLWRFGVVAQTAIVASGTEDGVPVWDFTTNTKAFTGPVHLVASSDDVVLGTEFQRRQAEFFTEVSVTTIDGAGHDFPWIQPTATLAAIRQTLTALGD